LTGHARQKIRHKPSEVFQIGSIKTDDKRRREK
jgi:hypothetical protein